MTELAGQREVGRLVCSQRDELEPLEERRVGAVAQEGIVFLPADDLQLRTDTSSVVAPGGSGGLRGNK
jgi:hypothetical protein